MAEKFEPEIVERVDHVVEMPEAIIRPTLLTPAYRLQKFVSLATDKLLMATVVVTDKLLVAVEIPVRN